jgi:hypothetical protein
VLLNIVLIILSLRLYMTPMIAIWLYNWCYNWNSKTQSEIIFTTLYFLGNLGMGPMSSNVMLRWATKACQQCDQIGRNLAVWLHLLDNILPFLLNKQFQHMVCWTSFDIKSSWVWMFWTFKLSFNILATFPIYLANFYSFFWSLCLPRTNTLAFGSIFKLRRK